MIDIHSHILPGIDDGAVNMDDTLQLCQYAVENGITHMLATPHIHPGRYENEKKSIELMTKKVINELKNNQIALKLSYAAEVRISIEVLSMVSEGKIPFIGYQNGFHYLLLEMPHSHILPGSDKLIEWLQEHQIKVIIAHPERNKEVQNNINVLNPFIQQGCLLQLTAASVSGRFGSKCQSVCKKLIKNKWVNFVATDAHNIKNRPPDLLQARNVIIDWAGENTADALLCNNQKQLTAIHFEV